MITRVERNDFLHRLLSVQPGVTKRETIQQSSCIVLKGGRAYTFSQEIACSAPTGLPKELRVAVKADKLLEVLKALPDEELDVGLDARGLVLKKVKGRGQSGVAAAADELLLPDLPPEDFPRAWLALDPHFAAGVLAVVSCTRKRDDFAKACVHVTPGHLEASDNTRAGRYRVKTFVAGPVLVRGESLRHMTQLGMTHGCATPTYLHFRNPTGLRLSVRKFAVEYYPPLDDFLALRGTPVGLPKALGGAAKAAAVFADADQGVSVRVAAGELTLSAEGVDGYHTEPVAVDYRGPDLAFRVPAQLVAELVADHGRCEVTPSSLRAEAGRLVYAACLETG